MAITKIGKKGSLLLAKPSDKVKRSEKLSKSAEPKAKKLKPGKNLKSGKSKERVTSSKSVDKKEILENGKQGKKVLSNTKQKKLVPKNKSDVIDGNVAQDNDTQKHSVKVNKKLNDGETEKKKGNRGVKRKIPLVEDQVDNSLRNTRTTKAKKEKTELKNAELLSVAKVQEKQETNVQDTKQQVNPDATTNLSREHILQCISAIFHLTEEQLKSKNALFDGDSHPVFLQVTCIRVPRTPKRQLRMLMPHSMLSPNDEVGLFVCDLQRGRRKDFEPTVEHYEELLKKHKCTVINSIIPLNQVKTEYDQYELKRKLVSSYDHFLVDGRIAGHLSHLLGKHFYKKRKLPIPIRMNSKDLDHEIQHALKKTSMQLHSYGDSHIVQVGNTSMEQEKIADNILSVCKSLSKNYPGGWTNIRALRIKTGISSALPIYVTLKNRNSVNVPIIQPRRPKAYRDVKGVLSTLPGRAKVIVKPDGDIIIEKKKRKRLEKKVETEEIDD